MSDLDNDSTSDSDEQMSDRASASDESMTDAKEPEGDLRDQPRSPDADPVLEAKLQVLRAAIAHPPPFCSGALALSDKAFTLMYGKREPVGESGTIDFLTASEDDLRQLAEACEHATFGMNDKDVLDLSYRTAGKKDRNDFMTPLDLERAGLMDTIRYDLLDGEKGLRPIYAELYNMNVYGTGSFFKAHKDTPRSTDMFGSLVIVFPAPHEGGALVLRHGEHETTFDSGAALKEAKAKEPSIAYVAFFSDVEHEVLPVTAGHRVTITYNLYFRDVPSQARDPAEKMYRTLPPATNAFLVAFQNLLADPMFLPKGGLLGFGLSHEYAVTKDQSDLNFLKDRLKGRDALVMKSCQDASLPVSIKVLYEDNMAPKVVEILCNTVCRPDPDLGFCDRDEEIWQYIKQQDNVDAKIVNIGRSTGRPPSGAPPTLQLGPALYEYMLMQMTDNMLGRPGKEVIDPVVDFPVHWVTKRTDCNGIKSEYAAYEHFTAALKYLEGSMCLIVEIGPPGRRA